MVDNQEAGFSLDMPPPPNRDSIFLDQDGRSNQNVWTAGAHIITAVIGSGVLSLAWATAQLGWLGGAVVIVLFSALCCISSSLLASCYRTSPTGTINDSYMAAVKNILGGAKLRFFGVIQYLNLFGVGVGYSIACAISMRAIVKQNTIQTSEDKKLDRMNINQYIITFGLVQIFISQVPGFRNIPWISVISAVIPILYSSICIGLGVAHIIANGAIKGDLIVISRGEWENGQKIWRIFEALAEFANAYTCSNIIFEIQNTFKTAPSEVTMKKASILSVALTTLYILLCGSVGYAAFGEFSPEYLLTGFGFEIPYWLVDLANVTVVLHLLGDYQACCRPIFALIEKQALLLFPSSNFIVKDVKIRIRGFELVSFNRFRLISRTLFVIITTMTSLLIPFFNDVIGLVGGLGFWPLTVYFPVEMYMKQKNIVKWSPMWLSLQLFSLISLVVSIAAVAGSVAGFVFDMKS